MEKSQDRLAEAERKGKHPASNRAWQEVSVPLLAAHGVEKMRERGRCVRKRVRRGVRKKGWESSGNNTKMY